MKKLLLVLFVVVFALSGCGAKSESTDVGPNSDDVVVVGEANVSNGDDVVSEGTVDVEESSDDASVSDDDSEMITVTGMITSFAAPYIPVIDVEYNPVVYNGKEFTLIGLDVDKISKYLDRDIFVYHLEGFPMINADNKYIDVSIQFSLDDAYDGEMGALMVSDYTVLPAYDMELVDRSNDPYPISYYQDVIMTLCLGMYGNEADNIMDNPGYENKDFKEAVDTVYAAGYNFVKENGYYKIVNKDAVNIEKMPTVDEICKMVGIDKSEIVRKDDGGYFMYTSTWSNDEIEFSIFHDEEELSGSQNVDYLNIHGYRFKAFGVSVSDNVNSAYEIIAKKYKGMYSHHDDSVAKYVYDINGYGFTLNNIGYNNDFEIDEYNFVKNISFYSIID